MIFRKGRDCDYEEINNSDANVLWLDIHTNSTLDIECSDFSIPGYIELEDDSILLNCTIDTSDAKIFDDWFIFIIEYNYLKSIEKQVEVRTSR